MAHKLNSDQGVELKILGKGEQDLDELESEIPVQVNQLDNDSKDNPLEELIKRDPPILAKPAETIKFLMWDLTHYSHLTQVFILTIGLFIFFQACAWIEELTFKGSTRFPYAWYMTAIELLLICLFSLLERWQIKESPFAHSVHLKEHLGIAVAMAVARGLTNLSLVYINYPTQVIFKSMKLLPIMIGSVFCLSNKHTNLEWISVTFIGISAILFSLGDKDVTPDFNILGIIIVLLSLIGDSAHSNAQERVVKVLKAGHLETMFYSNLFSFILVVFICIFLGELVPAIQYCNEHTILYWIWLFRSFVIYFGVQCLLLLVKVAGNVMANTIGAIRKITTILFSFLVFPKPWSNFYFIGLITFLVSCVISWKILKEKNNQNQEKKLETENK